MLIFVQECTQEIFSQWNNEDLLWI